MTTAIASAGTFTFPGTSLSVNRMGYGAMQLAGSEGDKRVWGPPRDVDQALAVLRHAIDSGINHIDTSDYYGPHTTNQLIRRALHPYPANLVIVTKIGAVRGADGSWIPARKPKDIAAGIEDNLRNLGLEAMDIVNLRVGGMFTPEPGSIAEPLSALVELKQKGLIRNIGLSTVNAEQLAEAQTMTPIVCVQNFYNLANRHDDAFIDALAAQGIAYVPYFPLGGFTPLQSLVLDNVAKSINATPMQVALAWLLHRAPNILLIPGTSSLAHLRENLAAASLALTSETFAQLDSIGKLSAS
jgi:pyridoxine 4-dehydrogenase